MWRQTVEDGGGELSKIVVERREVTAGDRADGTGARSGKGREWRTRDLSHAFFEEWLRLR
jgi:hypothetical protein